MFTERALHGNSGNPILATEEGVHNYVSNTGAPNSSSATDTKKMCASPKHHTPTYCLLSLSELTCLHVHSCINKNQ